MDSIVFVNVVEIKKLRSKEENLWQMNMNCDKCHKKMENVNFTLIKMVEKLNYVKNV